MYCYKCGQSIDEEAVVCPFCGCATKNFEYLSGRHVGSAAKICGQKVSRKSRLVALLLCIFLGGIGVHRYYIGKIGTGVLWTFTAGCFYIGWLIDIILIACGKMTDKDDRLILSWDGVVAPKEDTVPAHGYTTDTQSTIEEDPWGKKGNIKDNRWYGMLRIVLGVIYICYGIVQVLVFYQSGLTCVVIGVAITVWGFVDRKNRKKQDR